MGLVTTLCRLMRNAPDEFEIVGSANVAEGGRVNIYRTPGVDRKLPLLTAGQNSTKLQNP